MMEAVRSADNSKVKRIVKLADKKYRDAEGCFVAEGKRWVFDALNKDADIEFIGVAESRFSDFEERLNSARCSVIIFADIVFNKMSLVESSQGILAVLKIQRNSLPLKSRHCLFLDKVRDPGNLGTIIRTACAAGFTDIILNNCVDAFNPKVIRTSMSAVLNVRLIESGMQALDEAVRDGYTIVAADIDGEDVFKGKVNSQKLMLVVGSEADGISAEILKKCMHKVKIPMENIESLNAAVSAGILMYVLKN